MKKKKILKTAFKTSLLSAVVSATYITNAFAEEQAAAAGGLSTVNTGLVVIKTIVIAVCAGIGAPVIAKGGMGLAKGIKERDSNTMVSGIEEILGGIIMAGIGTFIGLFGV